MATDEDRERVEEEEEEEEEEPQSCKTVKDVPADRFVTEYAAHLRQADKLHLPPWVEVVKTAHWKELSPYDSNWYYTRAASVARHVYLKQGLGVGKLRKIYGAFALHPGWRARSCARGGVRVRVCLRARARAGRRRGRRARGDGCARRAAGRARAGGQGARSRGARGDGWLCYRGEVARGASGRTCA